VISGVGLSDVEVGISALGWSVGEVVGVKMGLPDCCPLQCCLEHRLLTALLA
jgi:hypothetical protein